jgi:pilus assembly protein CpaE
MSAKPAEKDRFDLGFDAEDEFTSPQSEADSWRQGLDADLSGSPIHEQAFEDLAGQPESEDPFLADTLAPQAAAEDPFAALPVDREPVEPAPEPDHGADLAMPASPAEAVTELAEAAATLGEAVVPKITIHAFCSSPTTIDLVKSAAGDRRMERASTIVRPGGLAAAIEHYQNQPTPNLVVVETSESAAEMLELLGRLAEVCDPGTKVMVIGVANDIALYRELMRQGVSDYLVPPLKTLQLIGAITALYADPSTPFVGRQIAFCSAKGGAGASTLAHNAAHEIAERTSAGTVIVDLDLAFGTAGLNFNQDPLQGILDALTHPDRLDPVLMDRMMAKHSDHLSLFAAPATLEQDYEIGSDAFEEVVRKVRAATPYVILDLPHAWSRWNRRMLLTSDDLVIVAEPELASLRNCKNIVDLVRAARPNDPPPKVVLNKVGVPGRPEISVKEFGEALGVAPDLCIPFDAKVFGQAANNGQMISEVAAKSKTMESIDQLTKLLVNQRGPAPAPAAKASFLAGLFKRR